MVFVTSQTKGKQHTTSQKVQKLPKITKISCSQAHSLLRPVSSWCSVKSQGSTKIIKLHTRDKEIKKENKKKETYPLKKIFLLQMTGRIS